MIPAFNEEEYIGNTIEHLQNQLLKPEKIILVNDGSTDKTRQIVERFKQVEIVDRKNKSSTLTRKQLAQTYNEGLKKLKESDLDYILLLDADLLIPPDYVSIIVERMERNSKLAVVSGVIKGEYSTEPRGGGRVVKTEFWNRIGMLYPVNYGFEGYLLWKAESLGYRVQLFTDVFMTAQRKTGANYNPQNYTYYGYGLKALGYYFPYALGRILLFSRKKPKGAFFMLKGFLEKNLDLYEPELREYIKKTQRKNFFRMKGISRAINLFRH